MIVYPYFALLAMAPPPPGQPQPPWWIQMGPLVLMVVVFYFVLIRPQQKKASEHAELLKSIKSGDRVVTSGGIVGVVVTVKEKEKSVTIRSADTKLEVQKSAITEIQERAGSASEA
jgi:preprotein translocase subunit YajC